MTITLLQWNIWFKEDPQNIASFISEIKPDIVCLQELTTTSLVNPDVNVPQIISKALDEANYYFEQAQSWNSKEDTRIQGNGIFTKFPITKKFSSFLQDPTKNPISFEKEGRAYVELELDIHGQTLTIGTAHLSYSDRFMDTEIKQKEIKKLEEILKNRKENFIFTGDLNAPPHSTTVQTIEKYLKNLGPSFERKTWTTKPFNKNGFIENGLNWRLDYLFGTNDIRIKNTRILNTSFSDHLPILAEIEI